MTARERRGGSRGFRVFKQALDLLDIPVIYGALCLAYWLRFNTHVAAALPVPPGGPPPFEAYHRSFLVVSVAWFVVFEVAGLYRGRVRFGSRHVLDIVRTVLQAAGAVLVGVFFYRDISYSRVTLVLAVPVATAAVCAFHLAKFELLRALSRRGVGVRNVVVVGGGGLVLDVWNRVVPEAPYLGLAPVGICGDRPEAPLPDAAPAEPAPPWLGPLEELAAVVERADVGEAFVAMPSEQGKRSMAVLEQLERLGVRVHIVPNVYSIITSSIRISELAGMPVVNLEPLPIHGWQRHVKGAMDRVGAALLLVLLSPVLLYTAWRIRRDSPGPVIYAQERVGLDGTAFTIYKFRSMRVDAEASTGPVWAKRGDARVTPFGAFIRKYSIDELPQLWNVLRGDMSLVGPRPERPFFVEKFKSEVPHYMARHVVRTGISGWAQVNGLRGEGPIEERTRYDIWYIENWSIWLDLVILVRTLWVAAFRPTGF